MECVCRCEEKKKVRIIICEEEKEKRGEKQSSRVLDGYTLAVAAASLVVKRTHTRTISVVSQGTSEQVCEK
jgi:hypothetical protein